MSTPSSLSPESPLVLYPIGLSDRVRSVLLAYVDTLEDESVLLGDDEMSQVAFCEYDNLAAHELLQRFQELRRRPLILVALRDPGVAGAIWLPKPVYLASLAPAIDAARRMLLAGQASDFVAGAASVTRTVLQSFMHDTPRLPMAGTTSPSVTIATPAPTERVPLPLADAAPVEADAAPAEAANAQRYDVVLRRASEAVYQGRMDTHGRRRGLWLTAGAAAAVTAGVVGWQMLDRPEAMDSIALMVPDSSDRGVPGTPAAPAEGSVAVAAAPAAPTVVAAAAVPQPVAPAPAPAVVAAAPTAPMTAEAPTVVVAKTETASLDALPPTSAGPRKAAAKAESASAPEAAVAPVAVKSSKASARARAEASASSASSAPAAADAGSIVVEKGDTLSTIAAKTMGNPKAYQRLFQANTNVLSTPHEIYPGQVLKVPPSGGN